MIAIISGRLVYPTDLFPRWFTPAEAQWVSEVMR